MFCEQLDYNLLFRWILELNWDEPGFDHSTFSRNRTRLLEHHVAGEFFRTVGAEARELKLTSDEHFSVDGTLIEVGPRVIHWQSATMVLRSTAAGVLEAECGYPSWPAIARCRLWSPRYEPTILIVPDRELTKLRRSLN